MQWNLDTASKGANMWLRSQIRGTAQNHCLTGRDAERASALDTQLPDVGRGLQRLGAGRYGVGSSHDVRLTIRVN